MTSERPWYPCRGPKLGNKGVYGKMDESVASEFQKLFEMMTGSIGTLKDFMGKALSLGGNLDSPNEVLDLKKHFYRPVLMELSKEIQYHLVIFDDGLRHLEDGSS